MTSVATWRGKEQTTGEEEHCNLQLSGGCKRGEGKARIGEKRKKERREGRGEGGEVERAVRIIDFVRAEKTRVPTLKNN